MKVLRVNALVVGLTLLATTNSFSDNLTDVVRKAVATNPNVTAAQANRAASLSVLDQAKGRFLPEIDINGDIGKQKIDRPNGLGPDVNDVWRKRRQVTIGFRQVLFDGLDRLNGLYSSQARISAASYKILARSEAVALNAIEAYIDVERHNRLLYLANQHVERHRSLLRVISQRLEGGKAPIGDVEQTRERLEGAKALVAQIDIARESAIEKFAATVGSRPNKLRPVKYAPGLPKSKQAALDSAMINNPRVSAAVADISTAGYDRDQFKSNLYPNLFLEGSATRGEDLDGTPGKNEELKAMLVLRWKLYAGGTQRARVAELVEREAEKIAEHDILIRELEQAVGISWARFSKGGAQINALAAQVKQNKKVVASYQNEYDANKRSLLDVLDAENTSFGNEFALSNARAIRLFSSYQLLAHMGMLLQELGVDKPAGGDGAAIAPPRASGNFGLSNFTIPPLK
ncbi:MAG: TolC family outer membrane protein [Salaquimonas sp.]